jgi:hypothetical protein
LPLGRLPAAAFELPLDYVLEQREWSALICFHCGEAEALTKVLLEAGICLDQATGAPADVSNPTCK